MVQQGYPMIKHLKIDQKSLKNKHCLLILSLHLILLMRGVFYMLGQINFQKNINQQIQNEFIQLPKINEWLQLIAQLLIKLLLNKVKMLFLYNKNQLKEFNSKTAIIDSGTGMLVISQSSYETLIYNKTIEENCRYYDSNEFYFIFLQISTEFTFAIAIKIILASFLMGIQNMLSIQKIIQCLILVIRRNMCFSCDIISLRSPVNDFWRFIDEKLFCCI